MDTRQNSKIGRPLPAWPIWLAFALALAFLGGCASSGNPRDPLEPVNRAVYGFNDGFDRVIAKPVAEGYRSMIPSLVRTGVSNFFSNLGDLWIAVNNVLQGKLKDAVSDVGRVALNTTVGLLGILDIASEAGLDKHNEDFGQTLGRWGMGNGAYVMLPFLGPSTIRDAVAMTLVDAQADVVVKINHVPTRNSLYTLRAVDTRAGLLDATSVVEEAALDKYSFIRDAYLQRRRSLVYDGEPPREIEAADTVPARESDVPDVAMPALEVTQETGTMASADASLRSVSQTATKAD